MASVDRQICTPSVGQRAQRHPHSRQLAEEAQGEPLTGLSDGRACVASSPHQAIHQARAALADEGNHAAGQAASLLAPDREDDQHSHGGAQAAVHEGHTQQHAEDASQGLDGPQGPQAAAHAPVAGAEIADHAASGAGEDVHHAKDGPHCASNHGVEPELVVPAGAAAPGGSRSSSRQQRVSPFAASPQAGIIDE